MSTKLVYNGKTKSLIADILKDYDPTKLDKTKIAKLKKNSKTSYTTINMFLITIKLN